MADAFLVPFAYPPGLHDTEKLQARNAEFGPLLGVKNVWSSDVHLGPARVQLVSGNKNHSYYFPRGHVKEQQDHYTWEDRGDGVLVGTLVPEGDVPDA